VKTESNPSEEYRARLELRRQAAERLGRLGKRIARVRLIVAAAFFLMLWLAFWQKSLPWLWLAVPAAAFGAAVAWHGRVSEKEKHAVRGVKFYENGLARIEDRWIGIGRSEQMRDDAHPYAADLDIFGNASLFELLSTARTRAGEETLADWLSRSSTRSEILERQRAVEDLRPRIDLREDLQVLGPGIRPAVHPDAMAKWGAGPALLGSGWPRVAAALLSLAVTGALFAALAWGGQWRFLYYAGLGIEVLFVAFYTVRIQQMIGAVAGPQKDLQLMTRLMARLEREPFDSPELQRLQSVLKPDGAAASKEVARLTRWVDSLTLKGLDVPVGALLLLAFAVIVPFSWLLLIVPQVAFAIEMWRRRWGASVGPWLSAVGRFEALCALAGYAYEHPADPMPEILEDGPVLEGEELGHPLIPSSRCVRNTVRIGPDLQLLVVSGSNMSGKSTLLRTIGVNAVLAFAGAPVRARSLRIAPLAIGATIRIQDSLQAGTSRFYAEIQRIRHIVDQAETAPVLFLLDEVLNGTNSHDRAVGAEAIVKALVARRAIGLVTTHDLSLARVADALAPLAANVHFEDRLVDGNLLFDYRMKPGVVTRSNALELMRAVGLEI
jgi:hypothetical protein